MSLCRTSLGVHLGMGGERVAELAPVRVGADGFKDAILENADGVGEGVLHKGKEGAVVKDHSRVCRAFQLRLLGSISKLVKQLDYYICNPMKISPKTWRISRSPKLQIAHYRRCLQHLGCRSFGPCDPQALACGFGSSGLRMKRSPSSGELHEASHRHQTNGT